METLTCEYCGKIKNELSFFIGATNTPDWCMIEGTGKIACPDCYEKASAEGQEVIRKATVGEMINELPRERQQEYYD